MEDILGVMIFIVFIALRVMSDRKKGMKKEKNQNAPTTHPLAPPRSQKPLRPSGQGFPAAAPVKKAMAEKAVSERKKLEPVMLSKKPIPPAERAYPGIDQYNLPSLEGTSDYDASALQPPVITGTGITESAAPLFSGPEDIRKAIVWSVILQKPRFKNKYMVTRRIS